MARIIDVTLNLKDNLSAALKGVVKQAESQIAGLKKSSASSPVNSGSDQGVSVGTIAAGNLLAGAISGVASGVVAAGGALVNSLTSAYTQAADANRGALGATSANAALLGLGFGESAKLTSRISAELAKSAEKLPGATKDYLDAFNGVSDTLSLSGGLTAKGLTKAGTEMVELVAMLGKASGSGSGATSTVIGKMLGDTGSESLFRIDAFEKVPAFKAILEKDLEKAGKTLKDFFKMDAAAKQEALVAVKQRLFSKDYVAAMNLSMDAQLDTLSAKLFDPTSGIFGFMREIKIDGAATTVFSQLGKTFAAVTQLASSLVGALGMSGDPMVSLANSIIGVRLWAESANTLIQQATSNGAGIGGLLQSIQTSLMGSVQSIMSSIGSSLMSGGAGKVGLQAGQMLGQSIQWAINSVRGMLEGAINNGGLSMIGTAIMGIGQFLAGALVGVGVQIPGIIGSALMMGLTTLAAAIGLAFTVGVSVVGGAISGIWSAVSEGLSSIGVNSKDVLSAMAASVAGLFSPITSALSALSSTISGAIEGAKSAISSVFSSAMSAIPGMSGKARYSGQGLGLVNTNAFSGAVRSLGKVQTASTGNLLEAMRTETRNMPQGSSLVVANSSELIVPRNRINEVLSGAGNQVNITINTQRDRLIQDTITALNGALRQPGLSMV